MLTRDSSNAAHTLQNVALIALSLGLLPVTLAIVSLSLAWKQLLGQHDHNGKLSSDPKRILVTGVGMTKGLALARLFSSQGCHVVGADFSSLACGRVSRAVSSFCKLSSPSEAGGPFGYIHDLLRIIRDEKVDLWVSCSGVASAAEDGKACEVIQHETSCETIQFDLSTTEKLHEKNSFIEYTKAIGLHVPETHTVTTAERMEDVLREAKGFKFIAKSIIVDDATRADMTLLPLDTQGETSSHLRTLGVSKQHPWILQRFIRGEEFCTHALVIRGNVRAFAACPSSEMLMHYEMLPPHSPLFREMLTFTRSFAMKSGSDFTGHLSFDFMVADGEMAKGGKPSIYPIECNPRAHTAVALFDKTPEMIDEYLSILKEKYVTSSSPVIIPRRSRKYYWIGHDLVCLFMLPLWNCARGRLSFSALCRSFRAMLDHISDWKDGTFEVEDPLPLLWLYHLYWPSRFLDSILKGPKWSRVNVSTTKMFAC